MPVEVSYPVEVRDVRDAAVDNQDFVIDYGTEGQPPVHPLYQPQQAVSIMLQQNKENC